MIDHLRESLKITDAQEPLWQKVAAVMRENAAKMEKLSRARLEHSKSMTAIDDLRSYSTISEAHAEGTRKMIPAFQALYDSMSDKQKKAADEEFREHYHQHHARANS